MIWWWVNISGLAQMTLFLSFLDLLKIKDLIGFLILRHEFLMHISRSKTGDEHWLNIVFVQSCFFRMTDINFVLCFSLYWWIKKFIIRLSLWHFSQNLVRFQCTQETRLKNTYLLVVRDCVSLDFLESCLYRCIYSNHHQNYVKSVDM